MANPSPSHNPTDGLGTAAVIILSGTGVTAINTGGVSQYKVTLSVSATVNPATTTLTAVLKDIAGSTFTSGNSNVVKYFSYANPSAPGTTAPAGSVSQDPNVCSVGVTSGVITALHPGQGVVEARFATTDENITYSDSGGSAPAANALSPGTIYSQILVTVGP